MWPGFHAQRVPDKPAYIMVETAETVPWRELGDRSNRLAQLLYAAGLRFGDRVALCMENNVRYLEVAWAAQRSRLVYAPVNSHFNADEVAYILDDCDAQAFVTSAALGDMARELSAKMPPAVKTRLVVGGSVEGYDDYEPAVAAFPSAPLAEELEASPWSTPRARRAGRRASAPSWSVNRSAGCPRFSSSSRSTHQIRMRKCLTGLDTFRWRACPVSDRAWADDPEFGYRFIADELDRAGRAMNERRVWQLCRQQRGSGRPRPEAPQALGQDTGAGGARRPRPACVARGSRQRSVVD